MNIPDSSKLGRVDVRRRWNDRIIVMSVYGMEVIDSGVARCVGMHAPWETTSKADVYEAVEMLLKAFFKADILRCGNIIYKKLSTK